MARFKRDMVVNLSEDWLGKVPYLQVQKALGKFALWHGDKFSYVHVSEDRQSTDGSLIAYFKVNINPNTQADYTLRAEYVKAEATYRYYS